jgi:hypothetical protein
MTNPMTHPIDLTKIRPGDKLELHKVTVIESYTDSAIKVRFVSNYVTWVFKEDIATHTPKPLPFKPGDRVLHAHYEKWVKFRIVAIDGGEAWIVREDNEATRSLLTATHNLRHADEGADR